MKKRFFQIIFFILSFMVFSFASNWAEDPTPTPLPTCDPNSNVLVSAQIDKTEITVGDEVNLKLLIEYPLGYKIDFSEILPEKVLPEGFFIKDFKKESENLINIKFTVFSPGEKTIPPIVINYTNSEQKRGKNCSLPINLKVKSVLPAKDDKKGENLDIKDIAPPVKIPFPWYFYAIIILLLAVIITALILIYRYINRKRKKSDDAVDEIPCWVIASSKLHELWKSDLISKNELKKFYIELSGIYREFIEKYFSIPVLDRTTYELYMEMKKAKIDKRLTDETRKFLSRADMVKFAKYAPQSIEAENDYKWCSNIVKEMIPETEKVVTGMDKPKDGNVE